MATAGFLDSKIKAKTNKTLEWLDKKDDDEQFRGKEPDFVPVAEFVPL